MKKICYVVTLPMTIKAFFIPQLKFLAENGYDVSVICSPDEELQNLLGNARFIPVDIPRGLSIGGSFKAISALKKIFKKEKFDLVQYSTPNAALYASIAAKSAKIKVRNYHLMGFRYLGAGGLGRKILRFIEKTSCRNSTSIECVSKSNLELGIQEKIFPREKATVVWNGSSGGVDLQRFCACNREQWRKETREENNIGSTEFVYGFVGRITKDKGITELIEAYQKILSKTATGTKLVLVGNIDDNHGLQPEIMEKIEKSKDILHITQKSDIERYYPMFDVLLLPSYREGFGNVVIEAQAMGVPTIVSDIPGPTDAMVEGKTGMKVPVGDVEKLAEAMEKALTFGKEFSQNATEFVQGAFSSEILCEKILQRKQELLDSKD